MCGIVGYVGDKQAANFLLEGLSKLEYRGYDSAGIAVYDGNHIRVEKSVGRLSALRDKIKDDMPKGTMGIGHTRWATHGRPSRTIWHSRKSSSRKAMSSSQRRIRKSSPICSKRSTTVISFPRSAKCCTASKVRIRSSS